MKYNKDIDEHRRTDQVHPYERLTPELVLQAVESTDRPCNGRLLPLNSYENRVYQIGLDDDRWLVAKFYRPQRWTNEAIQEEHDFSWELKQHEIPVIAPLRDEEGQTLLEYSGYRFALFKRHSGHWPELESEQDLQWMGRYLGRIHAVGMSRSFEHRQTLTIGSRGDDSLAYLRQHGFLPLDIESAYCSLVEDLLLVVRQVFSSVPNYQGIRLHGDFHRSNILWSEQGPRIVDLDDICTGPAIQDLWMLLAGERASMEYQMRHLLKGYTQFCDFDLRQLALIEALRTLRMLHYSAWLARRWGDPAFPHNFPWFNSQRYWQDQILALREQAALLQELPLSADNIL